MAQITCEWFAPYFFGRKTCSQEIPISRKAVATRMQRDTPTTVGNRIAKPIHLQEPVSFFMVRQVVEQGQ